MDDFLANMMEFGSSKNGWRSPWAIIGLVLGLGIGVYLGWTTGGFVAAITSGATGAFLGWALFLFLKGFMRFIAIFILFGAAILFWYWLTGKL